MTAIVTISIDAMGGDNAPAAVVDGVALAAAAHGPKARYLLHGRAQEIEPLLADKGLGDRVEIRHTDTFVAMDDKPTELRRSRGSSMWNAVAAVRDGEAEVAVSAGNTGALMTISKVVLRMMHDVHRPVIAASWPTPRGHSVVLDVGANVECTPEQLVEFAIMGEAFHRAVHDVARPTVGLLNVGVEELKGNETVRKAAALLKAAKLDIDYQGFVEGDDISLGRVDVVVTDGFTGNIALKAAEGTAKLLAGFIREAMTQDVVSKLGALLSRKALRSLRARMDPNNANGGVFLGLNGVVIKSHGGANAAGIATALGLAYEMGRSHFSAEVEGNLARFARAPTPAAGADREASSDTERPAEAGAAQ